MDRLLKFLQDRSGNTLSEADVRMMNPLVLAYIGDTIYDLFVRTHLILNYHVPVHQLHQKAIKFVKAGGQSYSIHKIEDHLTEEEKGVVRRGRNAKSGTIPKNANVTDYRWATGFESLLGYLYLTGRTERLIEIMGYVLDELS